MVKLSKDLHDGATTPSLTPNSPMHTGVHDIVHNVILADDPEALITPVSGI